MDGSRCGWSRFGSWGRRVRRAPSGVQAECPRLPRRRCTCGAGNGTLACSACAEYLRWFCRWTPRHPTESQPTPGIGRECHRSPFRRVSVSGSLKPDSQSAMPVPAGAPAGPGGRESGFWDPVLSGWRLSVASAELVFSLWFRQRWRNLVPVWRLSRTPVDQSCDHLRAASRSIRGWMAAMGGDAFLPAQVRKPPTEYWDFPVEPWSRSRASRPTRFWGRF